MKLQCEKCREIVPADFAVGVAGIDVHCPACGQDYTVAPTRGAAVDLGVARKRHTVPPAGAMTCAKCGDVQPPARACRSCGLAADKMAEYARSRDAQVSPEVQAAWDAVQATWSDDEAHERLLRAVAASLAYPWAAQRYREALRLRPDDQRAAEQLARLAKMAEATLLSSASRRPGGKTAPFRSTIALLAGMVILVALGAIYALMTARQHDDAAEVRPSPTRVPKTR